MTQRDTKPDNGPEALHGRQGAEEPWPSCERCATQGRPPARAVQVDGQDRLVCEDHWAYGPTGTDPREGLPADWDELTAGERSRILTEHWPPPRE